MGVEEPLTGMEVLRQQPFLRLLFPLVVGIACGDAFPHPCPWEGFLAFSVGLLGLLYECHRRGRTLLYGSLVSLLLACIGYQLAAWQLSGTFRHYPETEVACRVRVCELPEEKERSLLCPVRVLGIYADSSFCAESRQPLYLFYFPKDTASARLRRGDELLVYARLSSPRNNGNPDEFDYARFLHRRGGSGTAYVPAGHWRVVGHDSARTFRQVALDYRAEVVSLYRRLGFRGDELTVLSALTVGDQDHLSEEIVETYSVSGASHVLSLSGLHIGFLYVLLVFLLRPLWTWRRWLKAPLMFGLVLALWAFAFFTGLASPVVRSVTMFSLLALASLQTEKLLTMHSLLATCFLMLLVRPLWLFEVSFQLSFLSLAAILWLQPPLYRLWQPRSRLLRYVWGLMTVSVAAQAGVAPLVLFYFGRFSTHFLLSNLFVVPMASLILYAAVLLLLLTPFPGVQSAFAGVLDRLVWWQNEGLRWVERLPYASMDDIWVDGGDVVLSYVFLVLLYGCCRRFTPRRVGWMLLSLLAAVTWHTVSMVLSRPESGFAFYNVSHAPAVHCLGRGRSSWLVGTDTLPNVERISRSLAPHWRRLRLADPCLVADGYADGFLSVRDGILDYGGRRVCILHDDRWRGKKASVPLSVDYLYVCRGYKGTLHDLERLFAVDFVVFDASFTGFYRRRMEEECLLRGIPCHALDRDGAYFSAL